MLEYIQSRSLSSCNSIKIFDFSTLYTTIPHSKLKDKLSEFVLRIKKHVGEKRSTVCTHMYTDCLLKNTSTKENFLVESELLFTKHVHQR
jgi:hypothetical protein